VVAARKDQDLRSSICELTVSRVEDESQIRPARDLCRNRQSGTRGSSVSRLEQGAKAYASQRLCSYPDPFLSHQSASRAPAMVKDMTEEKKKHEHTNGTPNQTQSKSSSSAKTSSPSPSSWFSLPPAIRRVFDKFPLVTLPAVPHPQRSPRSRNEHILYIFQSDDGKLSDGPSFNPSCLRWQAYLKFHGIPLRTRPSNNHASPSGALPFLLPAPTEQSRPSSPVPASRLAKWVVSQGGKEEAIHMRQEAYTALIDHTIRSAWLCYLYLDHDNFESVASPLYVQTASSSWLVRTTIRRQLQSAAREELLKTNTVIDAQEVYAQAANAFRSLSTLLDEDKFFFGQSTPGMFDASLFAYSQVILDERLDFRNPVLRSSLRKYPNLVQHRDRLIRGFFKD
jgi:metaxin